MRLSLKFAFNRYDGGEPGHWGMSEIDRLLNVKGYMESMDYL